MNLMLRHIWKLRTFSKLDACTILVRFLFSVLGLTVHLAARRSGRNIPDKNNLITNQCCSLEWFCIVLAGLHAAQSGPCSICGVVLSWSGGTCLKNVGSGVVQASFEKTKDWNSTTRGRFGHRIVIDFFNVDAF